MAQPTQPESAHRDHTQQERAEDDPETSAYFMILPSFHGAYLSKDAELTSKFFELAFKNRS
jgi:hypothetical protein